MSNEREVTGLRSPRWAFMSRMKVHKRNGELYLDRLRLVDTPIFGVYLHRLWAADDDRALHDHPWSFASFLLCGDYIEEIPHGPLVVEKHYQAASGRWQRHVAPWTRTVTRLVTWFNFKRAYAPHRIHVLSQCPVWTLVFRGPRVREWGFYTGTPFWTHWKDFV